MNRNSRDIENICNKLLNGKIGESALDVSTDEFQKFYTTMVHLTKTNPIVSFVNLETMVVAQFSSLSPQHFDITDGKDQTEEDFDFVVRRQWFGATEVPVTFAKFIWREFLLNKGKLSIIFMISALILFIIDDISFYEQLISLLIESATVFLGLYIIFTVSQSQFLNKDVELFKSGILQRYYRDDRYITLLGILTIAFTFLGNGIVVLTFQLDAIVNTTWILTTSRLVRSLSIAFIITILFDTFLTVANYYLYRNRDVAERDIIAEILDADYRKHGMKNENTT